MNILPIQQQLRKYTPLRGYTISREELIQLFNLLQVIATEAGRLEVSGWTRQQNQTEDQFKNDCTYVVSLFVPYIQIETTSGATISHASARIFDSSEFPANISKIQIDTGFLYQARFKTESKHRVVVLLDFRTVASEGLIVLPAQATPNESCIVAVGQDTNWTRAAYSRLEEFFSSKKRRGTWIHNAGIYDLLLTTIGILFVAWVFTLCIPYVDKWFEGYSKIYNYSGYVFVFFMSIRFFMFMFDYARRMWPLTELRGANQVTIGHRFVWITLLLGVVAGIIKDLVF